MAPFLHGAILRGCPTNWVGSGIGEGIEEAGTVGCCPGTVAVGCWCCVGTVAAGSVIREQSVSGSNLALFDCGDDCSGCFTSRLYDVRGRWITLCHAKVASPGVVVVSKFEKTGWSKSSRTISCLLVSLIATFLAMNMLLSSRMPTCNRKQGMKTRNQKKVLLPSVLLLHLLRRKRNQKKFYCL